MVKAFGTADGLRTGHGEIGIVISNPIFDMPRDRMTPKLEFERNFDAIFPSRHEWQNDWPSVLPAGGCVRFTDVSKTVEGIGTGVFSPDAGKETWFHLGKYFSNNNLCC